MMNMLSQMMSQQGVSLNKKPQNEAEWLEHQKPVATAMKSLMGILEYEKKILDSESFTQMVDSLKENIVQALDTLKIPAIPPMSDVVSINGEPAVPVSNG